MLTSLNTDEDTEKLELSVVLVGMQNGFSITLKQFDSLLEIAYSYYII